MNHWIDPILGYDRGTEDRRPLTEKADPLALSWASYYVWTKFPERRFAHWNDLEAHPHDHEIAKETRRYYRELLTMRALKSDHELGGFSKDLYDICNGGIMRECHRGMIYRLPYFYVEDTKRQDLREHTQAQPDISQGTLEKSTRGLVRHDRIFQSRRRGETMEYWFHDAETGHAVKWPVDYKNPLRSLVDQHWQSHERTRIHGRWAFTHDTRHDFCHWTLLEPELRS